MTPSLHLKKLCSAEYASSVGFVSMPRAMRELIRRSEEFRHLSRDLYDGRLTEAMLEEFLNTLFRDYRKGVRFKHEEALATVVLLLERYSGNFAHKFIRDLAALHSAELGMATMIARESLRIRESSVPRSELSRSANELIGQPDQQNTLVTPTRRSPRHTVKIEILEPLADAIT